MLTRTELPVHVTVQGHCIVCTSTLLLRYQDLLRPSRDVHVLPSDEYSSIWKRAKVNTDLLSLPKTVPCQSAIENTITAPLPGSIAVVLVDPEMSVTGGRFCTQK